MCELRDIIYRRLLKKRSDLNEMNPLNCIIKFPTSKNKTSFYFKQNPSPSLHISRLWCFCFCFNKSLVQIKISSKSSNKKNKFRTKNGQFVQAKNRKFVQRFFSCEFHLCFADPKNHPKSWISPSHSQCQRRRCLERYGRLQVNQQWSFGVSNNVILITNCFSQRQFY